MFDGEVVNALLRSTLLDERFRNLSFSSECLLPSFAATYLQRRVLSEPRDGNETLLQIREISELLERASAGPRDKGDYLEQLCRLAMDSGHKDRAVFIFDPERCLLPTDVGKETCMAAWATNVAPIVEQWIAGGDKLPVVSCLFGFVSEHFPKYEDLSALDPLLAANGSVQANGKRLKRLREAAKAGSIEAVKYIWNSNAHRYPWVFDIKRPPRGYSNQCRIAPMNTPSLEVLEFLFEKQRQHCTSINFDVEHYTELLRGCAVQGWHETMERYIELGAAIDGHKDSKQDKRPLVYACRNGHEEVVRVLLGHGADTSAPALEDAAENGHLSIVRILLKHGAEIGDAVARALSKGYMDMVDELLSGGAMVKNDTAHMLVLAVKREHTRMFHFLHQRAQRPISKKIVVVCTKLAQEQGLDSMLELLKGLEEGSN